MSSQCDTVFGLHSLIVLSCRLLESGWEDLTREGET